MNPQLQRAFALLEAHHFERAETMAREALAQEPEDADAFHVLTYALLKQDKFPQALESAKEMLRLMPDDAAAHRLLGSAYLGLYQFEAGQFCLKKSLSLDPMDSSTLLELARVEIALGNFDFVHSLLSDALRLEPENAQCFYLRAVTYERQQEYEKAEQDYRMMFQLEPEEPDYFAQAGWFKMRIGKYEESEDFFREALRLKPGYENARQGLIENLRAHNVIFRGFLGLMFKLQSLKSNLEWTFAVIAGLAFYAILKTQSNWAIFGLILLYTNYTIFVWCVRDFFNVLLFAHPLGRLALTRMETIACVGNVALVSLGLLSTAWSLIQQNWLYGALAGGFLILIMPYSAAARATSRKTRIIQYLLFGLFFGLILSGFILESLGNDLGLRLLIMGYAGSLGTSWLSAHR